MKLFGILLTALAFVACGGGGNPGKCSGSAEYCAEWASTPSVSYTPPATVQATTAPTTNLCGINVGASLLAGVVTDVHDGDTVTLDVNGVVYKVRLDSIDAPELAQPFGNTSQVALATLVLGKPVKVAYSKSDKYDRIVGAVFTGSCEYVNLTQVATGMAWFYKAYQCEISASVRSLFAQAQDKAVAAGLGLWSQTSPEAPWYFRNGSEPVTPTCTSDLPYWFGTQGLSSVVTTSTANSSTPIISSPGTTPSICYTGPRGGTYTITSSGQKNYGGC